MTHYLMDTARGTSAGYISSNTTDGETAYDIISAFNSNGFAYKPPVNDTGYTYASWTFREQPKFFDVVTYTGNGTAGRQIAHNLGSAPGFMVVKSTSQASTWAVYHRSIDVSQYVLALNTTDAQFGQGYWNYTAPTSSVFTVGSSGDTNQTGQTYVAYLFAHDAGGFGLTGTDNVISCGSVLGGAEANLGFEPQWVLAKASGLASNWFILDTMRGFTGDTVGSAQVLRPNESSAETTNNRGYITSTGFVIKEVNGEPYIYIAIRRGPMKVPTTGTSVFSTTATSASTGTITSGFPTDMVLSLDRTAGTSFYNRMLQDRLRGDFVILDTAGTQAEYSNNSTASFASNTGVVLNGGGVYSNGFVHEQFRRAPGFFDEVCYTGAGNGTVISHNLGVEPELAIFKCRNNANLDWVVRAPGTGSDRYVLLNTTGAQATASGWYSATSSQITFPTQYSGTASSGFTYVAYLFASCPGVSKVFSFTGNGSSQTINCGFTSGSRFVMIKRTDSTGDWYVWDSARGIVSGNDPRLSLNTTAAEVTTDDSVDTDSTGFVVNQLSATNVNVNGASYIGLAIA
jgi:hypothetical protein